MLSRLRVALVTVTAFTAGGLVVLVPATWALWQTATPVTATVSWGWAAFGFGPAGQLSPVQAGETASVTLPDATFAALRATGRAAVELEASQTTAGSVRGTATVSLVVPDGAESVNAKLSTVGAAGECVPADVDADGVETIHTAGTAGHHAPVTDDSLICLQLSAGDGYTYKNTAVAHGSSLLASGTTINVDSDPASWSAPVRAVPDEAALIAVEYTPQASRSV